MTVFPLPLSPNTEMCCSSALLTCICGAYTTGGCASNLAEGGFRCHSTPVSPFVGVVGVSATIRCGSPPAAHSDHQPAGGVAGVSVPFR